MKSKYRIRVLKQIMPLFEGVIKWFFCNAFISMVLKVLVLIVPVFYALFIEEVLLKKQIRYFIIVAAGTFGLQVMISVLNMAKVKCSYRVNNTVFKRVRIKGLQQYFGMKQERFSKIKTGDVKLALEDSVEKLTAFGGEQTIDYFVNLIYAVLLLVALLIMNVHLAVITILFIPVTFFLDHVVSAREKKVNGNLGNNDGVWSTWLDESIVGWKEIRMNRLTGQREKEFDKFQQTDENGFRIWIRFWTTRVLVIPTIKDELLIQFLIYFLGGVFIYYDYLTIGVLLVFVQYYGMLSNTVKDLSRADADLQSNQFYFDSILELLTSEQEMVEDGVEMPKNFHIQFSDVSFGYEDSEQEVIQDLTFRIEEGERLVIRGASGAGKSTFLKLLLGALEPKEGAVSYGDLNLKNINKRKLYQKIAYISQESILFNDTIFENIVFGNRVNSAKDVEEACKKAHIHEFIETLPEGYQTVIGENGSKLSGGQRQRLILARAFLRDARVYVFDEATSALDKNLEGEIEKVVKEIPRDKTVIVVTHRENSFAEGTRALVL